MIAADISFTLDADNLTVNITAEISFSGHMGVEMEALTTVSVALLTVCDMCKAVQKDMTITDIKLLTSEPPTGVGRYIRGEYFDSGYNAP